MTQKKTKEEKIYYQVLGTGGVTVNYTHCSNIRVGKEDFYYLYNAENNSMMILKKVGMPLQYYMKEGELVILCYAKWDEKKDQIPCVMLSGLDEFSYQVNRAFVRKEDE